MPETITGEAADTRYRLAQVGFATKTLPASTPANAPTALDTVIYYDPSQSNGKKAAEELAAAVRLAHERRADDDDDRLARA